MANSLPGSPIVGYYNEETKDFMGHEEELVITEDDIYFEPLTKPYGFVDLNAKVWFQKFLDDNRIEREYLVTEGYLWTGRYPEVKRVFESGNNHSMELDKNTTKGTWTKGDKNKPQFFIINETNVSALCLLGEDVEPCFEGAQFKSNFSLKLDDDFLAKFNIMINELKEILSEGGATMNEETMVIEEVVEQPEVIEEPATETVEEEAPVETSVEEQSTENFEENSENKGQNFETGLTENSENNEGIVENESIPETIVEESVVDNQEAHAYSLDDIPEYTELNQQYSNLQADYEGLQTRYSALEEEVKTLRLFKAEAEKVEKEALIAKFCMLSDEDKADVVTNIDTYSLEEIEAKLSVICFRNKVNFNLEEPVEEKDSLTYNLNVEEELDAAPAWVKAIRETAKNM